MDTTATKKVPKAEPELKPTEKKPESQPEFAAKNADTLKHLKGLEKGTAPAGSKKCEERAVAAAAYPDLKQRVETDMEIIRNFGFNQSTQDIEAWGALGERARKSYENKAKEVRVGLAFDVIARGMKAAALASPALSQGLSQSLIRMFKAAGVSEQDPAYRIARNFGESITSERAGILARRIEQLKNAYDLKGVYDNTKSVAELPNTENSVELASSILSVAGWFSKGFGWAAKDVNTLSLAVYASEYNAAKQRINNLTTMTEAQLKDLSENTRKLRADTLALRVAERTLQSSPSCDSTELSHANR